MNRILRRWQQQNTSLDRGRARRESRGGSRCRGVIGFSRSVRVYVWRELVDMRKSFDGLSGIVEQLGRNLASGDVYLFVVPGAYGVQALHQSSAPPTPSGRGALPHRRRPHLARSERRALTSPQHRHNIRPWCVVTRQQAQPLPRQAVRSLAALLQRVRVPSR